MKRIALALIIAVLATPAMASGPVLAAATIDFSAKSRMANIPQTTLATGVTDILQKLHDDAVAALADANEHQDAIASSCYAAIVEMTTAKLKAQAVQGGGLLLVFQKVRDLNRLSSSPQGTSLIIGCAPLVQDAKLNMLDFFTKIGGAVLLKGLLIP